MVGQGQKGEGSASGAATTGEQAEGLHNGTSNPLDLPKQSPLFHAQHADRYARQDLIAAYENQFDCRLIVMVDAIFGYSVPLIEELVHNADPDQDLHLLLNSPGGDGEAAVRIVRSIQARCKELSVIVPDRAKSAGTILCMGAHKIVMGPTSDLGPVDPQFQFPDGKLVAAKNIIAAVEAAEQAVQTNPDTYPIHASLLEAVDALMVQESRAALARTADLVNEALKSHPGRTPAQVTEIADAVREPLIDLPQSHGAVFGAADAIEAKLPVVQIDPASVQWKLIWRLYAKYFQLSERIYEGTQCSHSLGPANF